MPIIDGQGQRYVEVQPVPAHKSETMVFNAILIVLGVIIDFLPLITQQSHVLGLDARTVVILGLITSLLGLIGAALRLTVTRPIGRADEARSVKASRFPARAVEHGHDPDGDVSRPSPDN